MPVLLKVADSAAKRRSAPAAAHSAAAAFRWSSSTG